MKFCTLLILDGVGERESSENNPVKLTPTPFLDYIKQTYPYTKIDASGEAVGKIEGQAGDSEVGHTNIGSGRVVLQEVLRINREIASGSFFQNEKIISAMQHVIDHNSDLHIMGLLSDGGVHSMTNHLYAFLEMAKRSGVKKVFVHVFTDGRDTGIYEGIEHTKKLVTFLEEEKLGRVATVCGRFYSMDREQNYTRNKEFYDALVFGVGRKESGAVEAIQKMYDEGLSDEFLTPVIIGESARLGDNDALIFFNYRKDRPRQILEAISVEGFDKFEVKNFKNLKILTPIQINKEFKNVEHAFEQDTLRNTLSEVVSKQGYKQLKVAETTKYAHVTYYLNGTLEVPFTGEDRQLFVSDKVASFATAPVMQAEKIADFAVSQIEKKEYKLVVVNLANADMVGHTADKDACSIAVATVDASAKKIVDATIKHGGVAIVTADHGNIEEIVNADGSPCTSHTTNRVMFVVCGKDYVGKTLKEGGKLADIAPTVLDILAIDKPSEMNGVSLIEE